MTILVDRRLEDFDANRGEWDACVVFNRHNILVTSEHDYYYAVGFGDALSVSVGKSKMHPTRGRETHWQYGVTYNYIGKPHYPVPAIR